MKELGAYWEEKDFRQREEQEMFGRLRNIKEARMAKIERRGSTLWSVPHRYIQYLIELYYLLLHSTSQ